MNTPPSDPHTEASRIVGIDLAKGRDYSKSFTFHQPEYANVERRILDYYRTEPDLYAGLAAQTGLSREEVKNRLYAYAYGTPTLPLPVFALPFGRPRRFGPHALRKD